VGKWPAEPPASIAVAWPAGVAPPVCRRTCCFTSWMAMATRGGYDLGAHQRGWPAPSRCPVIRLRRRRCIDTSPPPGSRRASASLLAPLLHDGCQHRQRSRRPDRQGSWRSVRWKGPQGCVTSLTVDSQVVTPDSLSSDATVSALPPLVFDTLRFLVVATVGRRAGGWAFVMQAANDRQEFSLMAWPAAMVCCRRRRPGRDCSRQFPPTG